jgi:hypothetical protein
MLRVGNFNGAFQILMKQAGKISGTGDQPFRGGIQNHRSHTSFRLEPKVAFARTAVPCEKFFKEWEVF